MCIQMWGCTQTVAILGSYTRVTANKIAARPVNKDDRSAATLITSGDVPFVGSSVAHTCNKIPSGECNGLDLDNHFISAPRQETFGQ